MVPPWHAMALPPVMALPRRCHGGATKSHDSTMKNSGFMPWQAAVHCHGTAIRPVAVLPFIALSESTPMHFNDIDNNATPVAPQAVGYSWVYHNKAMAVPWRGPIHGSAITFLLIVTCHDDRCHETPHDMP